MASEYIDFKMDLFIKENGLEIRCMAREFMYGQMRLFTKDNFK